MDTPLGLSLGIREHGAHAQHMIPVSRHTALSVILLFTLTFCPFSTISAPDTLVNAELEQRIDQAFQEGVELARATSCMDSPKDGKLAFKAYRDFNAALRVANGAAMNEAFAKGMKKAPPVNRGERNCFIDAMLEGRKTVLRGSNAAKASLDKTMLPETMGSIGGTMGGIMLYAQSWFIDTVAGCIPDENFRKALSAKYVAIMTRYLDDRGNKVTPDWLSYPFERSDGWLKTEIGVSAGHPSCAWQMFRAGMAAQVFDEINKAEDDTRGRWLVKRLYGGR